MHICFLDIDGTLVHTGGAGKAAFAWALAADFGVPQINNEVTFAGRSDRAITRDLLAHHGIEPTEENWQRFRAGYIAQLDAALLGDQGRVLPGVVELLDLLTRRGDVALGLLTGNLREAARRKLTYYGLWDRFPFGGFGDHQVDRDHIAADALSSARQHIKGLPQFGGNGAPLGRIVVIGDTLNDIRCARAIGARCVAVPTGHTSADTLRTGEPDVLVESLEDTAPILTLFEP